MSDADLFAIGGAVTFLFLAGAYLVLRSRYSELVSSSALAAEREKDDAAANLLALEAVSSRTLSDPE